MSKRWYNVVNPDQVCEDYGADSLRLYEMFLGPLEQYKPWNTAGLSGVHSFLRKLWKLYHQGPDHSFEVLDGEPAPESLKTLHRTIRKVTEDIEGFSFNTSVSSFRICVNELSAQACRHRVHPRFRRPQLPPSTQRILPRNLRNSCQPAPARTRPWSNTAQSCRTRNNPPLPEVLLPPINNWPPLPHNGRTRMAPPLPDSHSLANQPAVSFRRASRQLHSWPTRISPCNPAWPR